MSIIHKILIYIYSYNIQKISKLITIQQLIEINKRMGGKKKNKNQNKQIDVVEEANKQANKNQQDENQQIDTVKQQVDKNQQTKQPQSNTNQGEAVNQTQEAKTETIQPPPAQSNVTLAQNQQKPTQPISQVTVQVVPQVAAQKPSEVAAQTTQTLIEAPVETTATQTLAQHSSAPTQKLQQPVVNQHKQPQLAQHTTQNKQVEQKKEEVDQVLHQIKDKDKQTQKQEPKFVDLSNPQEIAKEPQVLEPQKTNDEHPSQAPVQQIHEVKPEQPAQIKQDQIIQNRNIVTTGFEDPSLQVQSHQDLLDGLRLVGMAAQQIIFQNPLKHQAVARGDPQFVQKFNPVAFHITERLQQQANIEKNTPPNSKRGTPPKQKQQQVLQQIKQSAQSIDPDPLELQEPVEVKGSIIKSIHEQNQQERQKQAQQRKRKSSQSKKSQVSSRRSGRNPTYTNPLPQHSQKQIQKQIKKQVDYNQVNKQMLIQRQRQWMKLQQKQLQPRRPSYVMINPKVQVQHQPVQPNRPEKLPYTNNLDVIAKEKITQQHKKIRDESAQAKKKLEQSQKLKKDMEKDNPFRKIVVSSLVTAVCLGACVMGKADKRIAAGASIASFVISYVAQK